MARRAKVTITATAITIAALEGKRWLVWFCICAFALGAGATLVLAAWSGSRVPRRPYPVSLNELLLLPPARLAEIPTAELNLLCAGGLCVSNEPDLDSCNRTLDVWAKRVRSETERHQYRYQRNPSEFENSPGFYRMLMMAVVLTEDFGVHYDPQRQAGPGESRMDDGFFSDPRAVFLHGLLGPERSGTCSSLPVLYVALGRQLGYPLKLVGTKGHLFVRWEDPQERFNVEVTGRGLNRFEDDYYRHWPSEITPKEEQAEGYLKSLTPPEELAVFLSIRGMCLRDQGRRSEAAETFAAAARLAPQCQSYRKVPASFQLPLASPSQPVKPAPIAAGHPAQN